MKKIIINSINLLCFPYAGGNRYSFNFFKNHLNDKINLIQFEYPGHGKRVRENLLNDINCIVEDAYENVKELMNKPYVIYGHSLGAIVAYLVVQKVSVKNKPLPLHLFISGSDAPLIPKKDTFCSLPKDIFLKKIIELGGIPSELINNQNMLNYIEPILRADFTALETYKYKEEDKLNVPITVMVEKNNNRNEKNILLWKEITNCKIYFYKFKGDHFFISKNAAQVCGLINKCLETY